MQWDLGWQGVGTLALMSVVFGAFAQVVFWNRATWWVGLVAALAAFLVGVFVSEVWFGWATAEELQPNIDGLSFDETLISYVIGGLLVLVLRYAVRGRLAAPVSH